jgi:hypothetical protein
VSLYSDLPFVHALGDGGLRPASQVVCIHATDNTADAGAEAGYARVRPDKTSAHFYVDDSHAIQALDTSHEAYGCLYHGNRISVQFELCGRSNALSDATLRRAAPVVQRVCREFGIPVRRLSADQVRAGAMGICGHDAITLAFPEDHGDHTDPGAAFPWDRFISYVNGIPATTGDRMIVMAHEKGSSIDWIGNGVYRYRCPDAAHRANALVVMSLQGNPNPTSVEFNPGTLDALGPVIVSATDGVPTTSGMPASVVMTQTDRDAIVAALMNSVPTAAQIATAVLDEQHRRDAA